MEPVKALMAAKFWQFKLNRVVFWYYSGTIEVLKPPVPSASYGGFFSALIALKLLYIRSLEQGTNIGVFDKSVGRLMIKANVFQFLSFFA